MQLVSGLICLFVIVSAVDARVRLASLDAVSAHDVVQVAEHMSWEAMKKVTNTDAERPTIPPHAFSHAAHLSERFFTITFDTDDLSPKKTAAAAKKKQMSLHVFLNSALMGPNYKETTQASNGQPMVEGHAPQNCFYHGTVVGEPRSRVAVSLCDQMAGVIQVPDATYMIQPKQLSHNDETRSPHHSGWYSQSLHTAQAHVMYTSADLKRKDVFKCGGVMTPDGMVEQAHLHDNHHDHEEDHHSHAHSDSHIPQLKATPTRDSSAQHERVQAAAPVTVEVYNVNDKAFYDIWGTFSEYHALFLWNIAASYYSMSASLDPPVLIRVVGQTTFTTANPAAMASVYNSNTADAVQLLNSFQSYENSTLGSVGKDQTTLLSGVDFTAGGSSGVVGLAFTRGTCGTSSQSINEAFLIDHPAFVAATIAHELGHNLGMCHDPPADRSSSACAALSPSLNNTDTCHNHIMAASGGTRFVFDTFSLCSQADYASAAFEEIHLCLSAQASATNWSTTAGVCGNGVLEPGEECDCGNTDDCSNAPAPLTNACCEGATGSNATACKLKAGRSCSAHQACCTANCSAQASSVVCRAQGFGTAPQEACDLAETCDGTTFDCPTDLFRGNGSSCTPGAPNTTFQSTISGGGAGTVTIRFLKLYEPPVASANITQYTLHWENTENTALNGNLSVATDALSVCSGCTGIYEISTSVPQGGQYRIWVTASNSVGEGVFDQKFTVAVTGSTPAPTPAPTPACFSTSICKLCDSPFVCGLGQCASGYGNFAGNRTCVACVPNCDVCNTAVSNGNAGSVCDPAGCTSGYAINANSTCSVAPDDGSDFISDYGIIIAGVVAGIVVLLLIRFCCCSSKEPDKPSRYADRSNEMTRHKETTPRVVQL